MRTRLLCLTFGLLVPAAIGCGDNAGNTADGGVDAKPPFKEFNADEGGEVRHEYVYFTGGTASVRSTTFLFEPGSIKYFEILNQNGCTDVRKNLPNRYWPTAVNPVAERTYLDPGTVTFTGGPNPLVVPKNPMMNTDPVNRDHPAGTTYFHGKGAAANDAAMYMSEKTTYDVSFAGSDSVPAQTFEDVMYMPAAFEPLLPTDCSPLPCEGTPVKASTPMTFTWTTPPDSPPDGVEIISLVGFTGPMGPAAMCIEPNDGSITVPGEIINAAIAQYPAGGTLARQTLTHVVRELVDKDGPTGRRIDFITVWCYATPFSVTP